MMTQLLRFSLASIALNFAANSKAQDIPPVLSKPCQLQTWLWDLMQTSDPDRRLQVLESTLERCEDEFVGQYEPSSGSTEPIEKSGWLSLQEQSLSGRSISGWWKMIPDGKAHPALIIACDQNCDPDENPDLIRLTRTLGIEANFHLIVLESRRSLAQRTGRWLVGPFEEAQDQIEAGLWLKVASKYRTKITSLHSFGQGRAGQITLYATLFSDANPIASDRKVLQSGVALCPLVRSGTELFPNDLEATSASWQQDLLRLADKFPKWSTWLKGLGPGEGWLNATLIQSKEEPLNWIRPFRGRSPNTREQWLEATDFVYQSVGLKTDLLVLGLQGQKDLADLETQHSDPRKSRLTVNRFRTEQNCQFFERFGHLYGGSVLRSALMIQNFEVWPRFQFHRVDWKDQPSKNPAESHRSGQVLADSFWKLTDNELSLVRRWQNRADPSYANVSHSFVQEIFQIRFEDLPDGIKLDQNWLNAHTKWILNESGEIAALEWVDY